LALTGCGGGGGSKKSSNPYAGTWQPEWSLAGAGQPDEGRLSLTIGSNGTCSGEIYNSTLGVFIPVSGTCGEDGSLTLTFQYDGKTYTITGTLSLTGGNLTIANFVYSVDGNNYNGVCETSPPQQAEASAGTYNGTWEREGPTGQITLNISADGKLTGTMTVDGHSEYGEAALTGMVDNAGKYVFTYKFPTAPDALFRSKGTYTKTGNTINGSYTTEEIGKEGTTSGTFSVTPVL
jgi:hypothetical protein